MADLRLPKHDCETDGEWRLRAVREAMRIADATGEHSTVTAGHFTVWMSPNKLNLPKEDN